MLLIIALVAIVVGCDAGEAPPQRTPAPAVPVAVALVLNTSEEFIGNDEFETDEERRYMDTLKTLKIALDGAPPAAAYPPGSQGVVIGYSSRARVIVPLGSLERVTGAALGTQRDYKAEHGENIPAGVSLAVSELARVNADRRILVVVGSSSGPRPDVARVELAATQSMRAGIELMPSSGKRTPS